MAKADKRARKRANQAQAAAARAAAAKRAERNRQLRFGAIGARRHRGRRGDRRLHGQQQQEEPKVATKNPTTTAGRPRQPRVEAGCVATVPKKSGNGKQYKTAPR